MKAGWWSGFALGVAATVGAHAAPTPAAAGPGFTPPILAIQFSPPTEYGYSLPPIPMGALARSGDCQTTLPTYGHPDRQYWPPQGKIEMSNDGGWCWLQLGQVFRSLAFVPDTVVVAQPANGQVQVEKMKDRISVAYRPSQGFTGSDAFSVRTEGPFPHTIPVAVSVGQK